MDFPQTPSTSKKDASKRTPAAKRSLDQALGEVLEGTPKSKRPRPKVNQALWKHFSEKEDDLDYAIFQPQVVHHQNQLR